MIQTTLPELLLTFTVYGIVIGLVSGALAYTAARHCYDRIVREIEIDVAPTRGVIRAPVQVDLAIRVPDMQTIQVPVEGVLVGQRDNAELAARMMKFNPAIRGRALATIFNVSPSTGQAYYNAALKLMEDLASPYRDTAPQIAIQPPMPDTGQKGEAP